MSNLSGFWQRKDGSIRLINHSLSNGTVFIFDEEFMTPRNDNMKTLNNNASPLWAEPMVVGKFENDILTLGKVKAKFVDENLQFSNELWFRIEYSNISNPIALMHWKVPIIDDGELEGHETKLVKLELLMDKMPNTASNWIDLAERKFFNGQHIHRMTEEFMIQVGDPFSRVIDDNHLDTRTGSGGPKPKSQYLNLKTGTSVSRDKNGCIKDEFRARIDNIPMTVSMGSRANDTTGNRVPHSCGSQFFFNLYYNDYLNWWYQSDPDEEDEPYPSPVFAKVHPGTWSVIKEIESLGVDMMFERPIFPVKLIDVKMKYEVKKKDNAFKKKETLQKEFKGSKVDASKEKDSKDVKKKKTAKTKKVVKKKKTKKKRHMAHTKS